MSVKLFKNISRNFEWVGAFLSPFKRPKVKFYFGRIKIGVPYMYPRKWVKMSYEDCVKKSEDMNKRAPGNNCTPDMFKNYQKWVPVKWLWLDVLPPGWKTKWGEYRYEWSPMISLVILKRQFVIMVIHLDQEHYWECYLTYKYDTDKTKSKTERIAEARKKFPCEWIRGGERINYWEKILKNKYK